MVGDPRPAVLAAQGLVQVPLTPGWSSRPHTLDAGLDRAGRGLCLRDWTEADLDAIVRACNDPESRRWLPLPSPYTREDARRFLAVAAVAERTGEGLHLAVVRATAPAEVIGCVGLKETDWTRGISEVGYWALPHTRGRGAMSAAVRALSAWALGHGLERIELKVEPDNTASRRVAVAAGFREAELIAGGAAVHGRRVDLLRYRRDRVDLLDVEA